ncbi:SGNH/GDSL hydrolase family protein [Hymenobacter sp. 102]|uniref:SGNH/GDSL hydrolase family protein n=1 Tax=Hymenobacter sp. 102 TaxID=3403152 RepID=UPI003CEB6DBD
MISPFGRRLLRGVTSILLAGTAQLAVAQTPLINPAQWTNELRAFARQDSLTPPPAHPILFYGSSSIRKWETLGQDFPGRPVLNRGFGGSRFPDALYYFDKLVVAYQPRQVLLYEGDNDIGSGATPQEVFQSFLAFEQLMQQKLPKVPLVFLAIKPSPSRWALYPQMQEANRLIREYIAAHPKRLRYLDTATPLLGPNGRPRPPFYESDSLHLTPAGYAVWKQVVGKGLKK